MSKALAHVGLDVHKETIVAVILLQHRKRAELMKLGNEEGAVRRFVRKLEARGRPELDHRLDVVGRTQTLVRAASDQ